MIGLPPGNILQYLHLKERLNVHLKDGAKKFIEVGSGNGNVSRLFLNKGYHGIGFDLNQSACDNNTALNAKFIKNKSYQIYNDDFITKENLEKVDIIISCMVIEHMPNEILNNYFEKCFETLNTGGMLITLVPSSMKHWGIEDDIAGHIKRYEFNDFNAIAKKYEFKLNKINGLTYPISNLVFSISNKLIQKKESDKLKLSQKEKTIYTGNRNVKYKTSFPQVFNVILNPITMYPFHLLQKIFENNKNNMVIYCELLKK